jgi:peptidyl-tRNA hydrolase, PTH1 family
MATPKRLILGLGNPEPEYAGTRHNVGFEVVRAVAERTRTLLGRFHARSIGGEGSHRARRFALAMPQTYMNLSGESALGLMRQYGLVASEILVVVDDLALDPGVLRLRANGSDGGHNGLSDLIYRLRTDAFPRLRVGIGRDFPRGRQADYVLQRFTPDQRPLVDEAIPVAAEAALTWLTDGLGTAMNRYNGWKPAGTEAPGGA